MSVPVFLHLHPGGQIWVSTSFDDTVAGASVYWINPGACLTNLGTITGNSGAYSFTGASGKNVELGGRK
jgi:hypothetical protein